MQLIVSKDAQEKFQKLASPKCEIRLTAEFLGGCGADTDFSFTYSEKAQRDKIFSFEGFEILISPEIEEMIESDLYIKLNSMNGFQLSTRSGNLAYNVRIS